MGVVGQRPPSERRFDLRNWLHYMQLYWRNGLLYWLMSKQIRYLNAHTRMVCVSSLAATGMSAAHSDFQLEVDAMVLTGHVQTWLYVFTSVVISPTPPTFSTIRGSLI